MSSYLPVILLVAGIIWFLAFYYFPLRKLRGKLEESAGASAGGNQASLVETIGHLADKLVEKNSATHQRAEDEGFNLRTILSSMHEGVVILDNQKRIRLANDAIYRLLPAGLSPINRTLLELFRNHVLHRAIELSFTTPEPQTTEYVVDVTENSHLVAKTLEVTSIGMVGRNGTIVGALAVFHDLTRVKVLEGMRKDFVANVSHELRTPLSIISGYIETMLEDDFQDVQAGRKFLRVMHKHTERLHLLVEDLLTISMLESQRAPLDFSETDLRCSVQRVMEQLEPKLQAKDLEVKLSFPKNFPLVEADVRRMDQVFFNLLDNAIKHGRKGDRPIKVSGEVSEEEVCISVRDDGPGIASKDQPHIFERFYRVDEARSRDVGGTGLGLSIVKHVVQAHGGQVEVVSKKNEGAEFLVTLPLLQSGETKSGKPRAE